MRRSRFINLALMFALALPFSTVSAQQRQNNQPASKTKSSAVRRAADRITAEQLKEYLYYVASDEMQGRDTPSPGLDATARFIADKLKRRGIKPAGDNGTYFQKYNLLRLRADEAQSRAEIGGQTYKFGDDFLPALSGGSAEGPLVYVGHGWFVKSKGIDAYQGVDVRDKIMVVAGGARPDGVTPDDLKGKQGEAWDDFGGYARRHGARGIVLIPRTRDYDQYWQARRSALTRGTLQVEAFMDTSDARIPTLIPSQKMLDALMTGERMSGEQVFSQSGTGAASTAFDLTPAKRISFTTAVTSEKSTTQNVVGVLEGSDRVLKNEYVAIGAHYDHVGTGTAVNGDSIYNGADDDGSGTVGVLAIAEALARGPRPKRSILFVWHSGEEKGLWGSRYFVENPTVPLAQVVAQLNIDMIGRSKKEDDTNPRNRDLSGANEVYVIGSKMMSTDLGLLSERINASYLNVNFNYKYDDPSDPNRFFFRSDHYHYARKGVPIIFYFSGVHEDYHRPSDSPDKIDYEKMQTIARTIFMTATEIANLTVRPRVDKQLPSELTTR
ncbi:MAG: M20/M25/M40 family metallo-hydrolase [Pyrinomonadaceae bacterium]|nr:M20/M25/M40 family metallo-hydrolase [Pyrinomonadaceae bacterium]